jgi:hypothetical protein
MTFQMPTYGNPSTMFNLSNTLVEAANKLVTQLTDAANFQPFSVPYPIVTLPPPPTPVEPLSPTLVDVTWTTPTQPGAFTEQPPQIAQLFPGQLTATPPVLNFGSAPASFSGQIPAAPALDFNFVYPVIGPLDLPAAPSLLSINVIDFNPFEIPQFTGTAPVLTIAAPTPLNWSEGWTYTSTMLETIQDEITSALTTDTDIGLSASVQQAMWDAAQEREFIAQAAALADLDRLESMGFALPSGIYVNARKSVLLETQYRMQGLSRDIMIKQAELRLDNVTKCRELAVNLEGKLIDYANQVQQRAFEFSRAYTEALVQIYNAGVQAYTARVEGFKATIAVYDTQIRGIEAQIAQLKAQVEYEQTKAEIDKILVDTYTAQINAQLATLEIAKVQVQIIQTQAEVEKTQVEAYSAQIQAFVGTVNAYTAEVEGYKANAEAQGVIESVYKTTVDAYAATVQAAASEANALMEGYKAQVQGYEAQLDAFKAALSAMVEQARAASEFNQAVTQEYTAQVQAQATFNDVLVKEWQAIITEQIQYAELITKTAEANGQLAISARQITDDAIKGAATVMAQLGAAALGAIHWSSNANWSDGFNQNFNTSTTMSTNTDTIYSQSA